ncbi:winged helix-turn-helix transcriptional regulator [Delftia acidovorans]|uniref:winged helix-turn-helix transcriptional regulator n=1 Tax=Delftia acidovorans TaxID=80866 RepID=UPI003D0C8869
MHHEIPGIFQRSLNLDHRPRKEAGLVSTVYPMTLIKVEYELTQDGERLKPVVGLILQGILNHHTHRIYVLAY